MRGLLRKDLYMAWSYFRMFLLLIAMFVVVSAVGSKSSFLTIYPMIIGMMLPASLLSYDEKCRWNLYCDATPVSRALAVSEKYLLTLLTVLLMFVLIMLAQALRLSREGALHELWELVPLLLSVGLVGPALLMPVFFRFGVERGRLFYFVLVGVVCALGVLLSDGDWIASLTRIGLRAAPLIGAPLLFAASWLLSIRLYQKREL